MKRIFALISILCLSLAGAYAAPISQSDAQKTASTFFGGQTASLAWSETQTKSSITSPAYFAFNNPAGGWVIIAGDDCCEPVLGYSETGSFSSDNLPSNFLYWMNVISNNVGKVRKAGLKPSNAIKAKWARVAPTKAGVSQKLLETASWNQESPYNDQCPKYKSKRCLTGCVATAMAIVLRYNKYPEKGTGTIPAYTTESNNLSVDAITLGASYDWDNMPLEYGSGSTTAQKAAVATLMLHCGTMVQMDYDPDGSGAYSCDIVPALAKYMGYSNTAVERYRYNYSNNDWFKMIQAEIDSNHPMIYGGADLNSEDGHQFVLDGYDSNNMVHINWGWGGSCNSWYAVNYLGDATEVQDVFNYCDGGIFGLVPSAGATDQNVELCLESQSDDSLYGISLASGTIGKGSSFALNIGFICNYDYYTDYSGSVKVGLYDKDGNLKEYVSSEVSVSIDKATASSYSVTPGYTTIDNLSCSITKDIVLGDYLQAVYKGTDGSWLPMGGYNSDEPTTSYSSEYEFYTMYKLGALDIAMLNVPQTLTAGQVVYFELVGSHKLPSAIVWYWDGSQNKNRFATATSGKHTLKAVITYTDGTEQTVQKVFNVQ